MFDQVEKLKQEYTDKYVVVDASLPELARFQGHTGQVKTVNMSGRALVQFDAWANIGWYDIDLGYLKVVPKPEPVVEAKHAAPAKAAPAKKPADSATAEKAPVKPAAKSSTADILAAARAKAGAAPAGAAPAKSPAPAAGGKKPSTADILAAARAKKSGEAPAAEAAPPAAKSAPAAAAAKSAGGKLSTADILAAARAKQAAAAASVEAAAAPSVEEETPQAEPAPVDEIEVAKTEAANSKSAKAAGPLPTTTAEKIAWCRAHDTK